jgi:hypothetical protein
MNILGISQSGGEVLKLTVDFIEDYQSDIENPSILLLQVVSLEVSK